MTKEMEALIDKYWDEDQHDKIVEMILAVPEKERDIDMLGQLVVAYNNLDRYKDAITLSKEIEAESAEIPAWYYRMGYAYIGEHDFLTAAEYLKKGIVLANKQGKLHNILNCRELYEECEPYIRREQKQPVVSRLLLNYIGLDDYKKAIFVNGMTEEEFAEQVKKYEKCASGGENKAVIKVKYASVNSDWIYVDYEYANDFEGWNFWHYQNFLLWLTNGKNNSFAIACRELNNYEDMLYSYYNPADKRGASAVGSFKGVKYYYNVPEFSLEWFADEEACVWDSEKLYSERGIDVAALEHMDEWTWKTAEMVVSD